MVTFNISMHSLYYLHLHRQFFNVFKDDWNLCGRIPSSCYHNQFIDCQSWTQEHKRMDCQYLRHSIVALHCDICNADHKNNIWICDDSQYNQVLTHYKIIICAFVIFQEKLFPRNYKRFPRSPGTLGLFLQWMAILSLLFPKFLMVGTSMKPAPYFFGVIFLLEYSLIIIYNKMVYGIFAGKFIKHLGKHWIYLLVLKFLATPSTTYLFQVFKKQH